MTQFQETRRWVRLVIVNAEGELLLFADHEKPQVPRWSVAGDALLPDEDYPAAAMRILEQKTGLRCPLGPLLREHEGSDRSPTDSTPDVSTTQWFERYFLVRCPDVVDIVISSELEEPAEESQGHPLEYRWWSLADLYNATDNAFTPSWLPELLASVLVSEPPLSPSLSASV
ncbi:NUDIX domain-containing protein [Vreelandella zhanjiangensis]|uniref:NUDIX domain-containing protein n=1 Tax=Vreelandella zhanjiangensis TaxID=1121960 RepID=UPI00402A6DEF